MLEKISCAADVKKLSLSELELLCKELRQTIISTVKVNGGHLASNLGVVELTVALDYVFGDDDKIVWDVGHQCYVHKLLTGRNYNFNSLRQKDGVCGFPDVSESKADAFNVGHASTSISAALGIACARDIRNEDFSVVAVVGDGALTGGESYEALNNVQKTKMLIVFNDNDMSIDKNVGSATRNLSKIRVGNYDRNKAKIKSLLAKIPYFGKHAQNFIHKVIHARKLSVLHNLYFDNFDLRYVGPVDGHDLKELIFYLSSIKKNVLKPTVLHVRTIKGKGLDECEDAPDAFHKVVVGKCDGLLACKLVGTTLIELAETNEKVVCVTAAMSGGVGIKEFAHEHPNRFFDVGIAEEHAVTFCGGLASQGLKPYFAVYSTFLQRGFDQVLHDIATQNLSVTFLVDKSGYIGDDGQSHQGLFDISYLNCIPNLTLLSACTSTQLEQMLRFSQSFDAPLCIRYNKTVMDSDLPFLGVGKWSIAQKGGKIKLLVCSSELLKVALKAFSSNKNVEIVCVTSIKPLDYDYLNTLTENDVVITLEDNVLQGGFGSAVKLLNLPCKVECIAVDDKFVKHATVKQQMEDNGMDEKSLEKSIKKYL